MSNDAISIEGVSEAQAPVSPSGHLVPVRGTMTGYPGVVLREGLMQDSSSVEAWLRSHATIVETGVVDCTVGDTAYQLTAVDTPCNVVYLSGLGTGPIIWGDSGITVAGACVPISNVVPLPVYIINANLIYVASATAGDDVKWTALKL